MSWNKLGKFQISQIASDQFAQASGDYNPLHVSPTLARRYQFGSTVIHGVCGVLKAIDLLLMDFSSHQFLSSVNVQFIKPILHDEKIEMFVQSTATNSYKIRLFVNGKRVQEIKLLFMDEAGVAPVMVKFSPIHTETPQPEALEFSTAEAAEGLFDLIWDPDLIKSLFPYVKEYLPDNQTAVLLDLTNIVGMQCPGADSVFAGLKINFLQNQPVSDTRMSFKVTHNDSRFSLITIGFSHNTATGEIEALFRPKPVIQEQYTELQTMVTKNSFANQRALIIGGSRGIGEVTAKLIAAGGGHSVITYFKGLEDANNIARDIQSHGGKCDALRYNVLSPMTDITNCFAGESVTHIYYFASPLIEKGDHPIWNDEIFQKFCSYYLSGFTNLIEIFLSEANYNKKNVTVFIPSTIFIDQPQKGFNEYIAAKAAVEATAKQLAVKIPAWSFNVPRLPRMLTDQTSGLAVDWTQKTAEVMLAALYSIKSKVS